ncbi:MAG: hypothetical protein AAB538_05900 [Patescibacteria group bacterium]
MKWYQSKTNLSVIITALANILSAVTGIELPQYFNEVMGGLIVIFLRQGITKSGPVQ